MNMMLKNSITERLMTMINERCDKHMRLISNRKYIILLFIAIVTALVLPIIAFSQSVITTDPIKDDVSRKTVIKLNLMDGQRTKGETVDFWVTVTDHEKHNVPVLSDCKGHLEVLVNETQITSIGTSGNKTKFRATVKEGRNTIKIIATDKHNNYSIKTIKIRCDTSDSDADEGQPVSRELY